MLLALSFGPIVVVSRVNKSLKNFKSGIYRGEDCKGLKDPNHASLLYGYDFNGDEPVLLFKNNWGTDWGEDGYYKVRIGSIEGDNFGLCLIANTPYNVMPIV